MSDELATINEEQALALQEIKALSDSIGGGGGRAVGRIGEDEDKAYPILSIISPLSDLYSEDPTLYKIGDMFNSVTKENYGTELVVIPVFDLNWYARLIPGSGLMCVSRDCKTGDGDPGGECAKCSERWTFINKTGTCSREINFFCLPASGAPEPFVIKFRKARYKIGQQLRSIIDLAYSGSPEKYPASWCMAIKVSTHEAVSRKGQKFPQFKVQKVRDSTVEEIVMGTSLFKSLQSAGVGKIKIAEVEDEGENVDDEGKF